MIENANFWRQHWQNDLTPWDLGGPHPFTDELVEMAQSSGLLKKGHKIWVPGCGRAHEARLLAESGFQVIAEDIVDEAIEAAQSLGTPLGLKLRVANALSTSQEELGAFDAVFDRAMLCALNEELQNLYHQSCIDKLRPGGLFLGILFGDVNKAGGPPFAIKVTSLLEKWQDSFTLVACSEHPPPYQNSAIVSEYLVILRRKD